MLRQTTGMKMILRSNRRKNLWWIWLSHWNFENPTQLSIELDVTSFQTQADDPSQFASQKPRSTTSDGSDLSFSDWDFIWDINGSEQINTPPTPDFITWQFPVGATYYPINLVT